MTLCAERSGDLQWFRFGSDAARPISDYASNFRLSRLLLAQAGEVRVDVAYLGPGEFNGLHPAGLSQLFCVVNGSGWVRGVDEKEFPISEGDAIFWEAGEMHAAQTDKGFTAIIVQSTELNPSAFLTTA